MDEYTKKIQKQNPLLTAAGQGIPFDLSTNTLFMPVTPAAPEPVHHELQEEIQLQKSIEEIKSPILLQQSNSASELQHQFEPLTDLSKDKPQQQQGYFTSILSSLPNLSLSGIRDQPQQSSSQATIFDSPQAHSTAGLNSSTNSISTHFSPVHISSGTSNDPSRPIAPPTVALPPPSAVPPVSGSVSSYRLGNQRRLKYALPPDLKSIPTKNSFEPSPKPEFINPTYSPSSYVKNDKDNKYIENIENVHSTLSSEFSSNEKVSEPQEIPTRKIYRDLVTPNNTPADYFLTGSTFDANYQSNRDDADAIAKLLTVNSSTSQFTPQSNTTSIDNFADIDLSQSFSQSTVQIKQNQQSPEVLFAPVATTTTAPIDFFSSNTTSPITEPSITSFFDDRSSLKSDNNIDKIFPSTIQVEQQQRQQEPSNVSFYNPLDYTSKTYNQQYNIDSQSPISFASNIQSSVVNDENNINNWSASPLASFMTNEIPESTGTATLSPIQTSINPLTVRAQTQQETIPPSLHSLAAGADKKMQYRPVYHHWFYSTEVENKILWHPFSMYDSLNLEEVHNSSEITIDTKVPTDGGRYDVEILKRQRLPVYWSGKPSEVKRSSWFYKGPTGSKYVPYDENIALRLEEEYKQACSTEHWNRKIEVGNGEYVVFHSPTIQIHYLQANSSELVASWGNTSASENNGSYLQGTSSKVKVVKRGVDEFHIEEGEPEKIDHLLFLVHGIGSVCDLKFRSVEEVVDEFRSISLQLVESHYRTAGEQGVVNRIEVLPISWHTTLHSEDTGIDKKLKAITLESIPRLRHFTNDTLLDVLFYTSPTYCQTIMQTVGNEMNRLHSLFKERNTNFNGNIYLGGHSLGSLIVFDLLCHQKPPVDDKTQDTIEENENSDDNDDDNDNNSNNNNINIDNTSSSTSIIKPMPRSIVKRKLSRKVSYVMGAAGTGQPFIIYPHLNFNPKAFFALGSPIGMFVTVRGIDTLGEDFHLPTCPAFFNIFHPFDPVAYRVESLVNPDAHKYRPMLIPHHKGRKRMHLELKETMARVGADLKQKLLDSVKSTWNSVYQLAMFHRSDNQTLEHEINKVVEEEMVKPPNIAKQLQNNGESEDEIYDNDYDKDNNNFKVGNLNAGRRIDYVLQEAPFEYINEYIFALTSHVCYWESEDTMLMILKEIYSSNGIQADAQLPQQTMTIERQSFPSQSTAFIPGTSAGSITTDGATTSSLNPPSMNNDPTTPIINKPIGPPPLAGFVRPKEKHEYREFHYSATAPED